MTELFEVRLTVACPGCNEIRFFSYSLHSKMKAAKKAFNAVAGMCGNIDGAGRVTLSVVTYDGLQRQGERLIGAYYLNEIVKTEKGQ